MRWMLKMWELKSFFFADFHLPYSCLARASICWILKSSCHHKYWFGTWVETGRGYLVDVRVECGPSYIIRHRVWASDGLEHAEKEIILRTISNDVKWGMYCYDSVASRSRCWLAEKFECDHVLERRFHYDTICKNERVRIEKPSKVTVDNNRLILAAMNPKCSKTPIRL